MRNPAQIDDLNMRNLTVEGQIQFETKGVYGGPGSAIVILLMSIYVFETVILRIKLAQSQDDFYDYKSDIYLY